MPGIIEGNSSQGAQGATGLPCACVQGTYCIDTTAACPVECEPPNAAAEHDVVTVITAGHLPAKHRMTPPTYRMALHTVPRLHAPLVCPWHAMHP